MAERSHRAQGRTIAVSSGEHHTGILAISSPYARRCFSLMSNTTISLGSQVIDPSRLSSNAGTRLPSSQLYPSNGRRVGFFFYVSIAPSRSRLPYVVSPTLVLRVCNSFKLCRGRWNGWITLAILYLGCHGMQEASCA